MFTYAMIVGVQHGWLEAKEYGNCARKGWIGLCGYIDADGNVREICVGIGQNQDTEYYLNRPRAVGDLHGQAPVLWCAWALAQNERLPAQTKNPGARRIRERFPEAKI